MSKVPDYTNDPFQIIAMGVRECPRNVKGTRLVWDGSGRKRNMTKL